jgi:hypothetical protein
MINLLEIKQLDSVCHRISPGFAQLQLRNCAGDVSKPTLCRFFPYPWHARLRLPEFHEPAVAGPERLRNRFLSILLVPIAQRWSI